jgi:membrane-bound metal-dependent hydrolase YbcI (DUF457 family)
MTITCKVYDFRPSGEAIAESAIMPPSMPSPIGHALAGVAVALAGASPRARQGFWRFLTRPLTVLAVALATLPDADLFLRGFHRSATHSLTATAFVTIVAIVVTGWVTRVRSRQSQSAGGSRQSIRAVVLVCAAAHASHLLTDWLGADFSQPSGIQLLWPFGEGWFTSGWDIFPQIERRDIFSAASIAINMKALIYELAIMGSIVAALWFWVDRSRSAVRIERLNDRHQA